MSENEKNTNLTKLKRKFIILLIIILVIIGVIGGIFLKGYFSAKSKYETEIDDLKKQVEELSEPIVTYEIVDTTVSVSVVEKEIKAIGELATQEYTYTNAGSFTDSKQLKNFKIPFTEKSFIVKWDGTIKAGIDVQKVVIEVDDKAKIITVQMPQAKILSHELDESSFEVLREDDNIFNPIEIEDVKKFDAKSKETMEQRAIDNSILDKAYENAKNVIIALVYTEVVEAQGYTIEFKMIK